MILVRPEIDTSKGYTAMEGKVLLLTAHGCIHFLSLLVLNSFNVGHPAEAYLYFRILRWASTGYTHCYPGQRFLPYCTGLPTFSLLVLNVFSVNHHAEA